MNVKFKIWQLPNESNKTFMPYDANKVVLSEYNCVYEGCIIVTGFTTMETLETIYHIFNVNRPNDYKSRSLSMSDIVELNGKYYYCDRYGFEEVEKN